MIFKKFIRNNFHFLIFFLALFFISISFISQKFSRFNDEIVDIVHYQGIAYSEFRNRLSGIDARMYPDPNFDYEYLKKSPEKLERMNYYREVDSITGKISSSSSRKEDVEKKIQKKDFEAEKLLEGENELISLYERTKDKKYNILDKSHIETLKIRNDILKDREILPLEDSKIYFETVIAKGTENVFSIYSLMVLAQIAMVLISEDKITTYIKEETFGIKMRKVLSIVWIFTFYIFSGLFLLLIFSFVFGSGTHDFNYPFIISEFTSSGKIYHIARPIPIFLMKSMIFLILLFFLVAIFSFLEKLKIRRLYRNITKVAVALFFYMGFQMSSLSRNGSGEVFKNPTILLKINFPWQLSSNDIVALEIVMAITILLFIISFKMKKVEDSLSNTFYFKRPFELGEYFARGSIYVVAFLVGTIMFSTYISYKSDTSTLDPMYIYNSMKNYRSTYEYFKKQVDENHEIYNVSRGLTDEMRSKMSEEEQKINDMDEKADLKTMQINRDYYKLFFDNQSYSIDLKKNYKDYYKSMLDILDIEDENFEMYGPIYNNNKKVLEYKRTYIEALLDKNIVPTLKTSLTPFSPYEIKSTDNLSLLKYFYINDGINYQNNASSYLFNAFYLKMSLALVILIPIFTNFFAKKKKHIELKMNLPIEIKKIYCEMTLGTLIPSILIFLAMIFFMGFVGFLYNGFGFSYPILEVTTTGLKEIGIGNYIIKSLVLSVLGIIFVSSLLNLFVINTKGKTGVIITFLILIFGILASYVWKGSYFLPFSYLDSGMIANGFYRGLHEVDGFNMINGMISLIVSIFFLNILSFKSLIRGKNYK